MLRNCLIIPYIGTMMNSAFAILCVLLLVCTRLTASYNDFKLGFAKDKWYNPSLVEYGDDYISAVKSTSFKRIKDKTWWFNSLFMCKGSKDDLHALKCNKYNPWPKPYKECEFDSRVRKGKLDTSGLGDVKVWRWPGKGVYAIFGRKPQRNSTSSMCGDLLVYHQWIAQIESEVEQGEPWYLEEPLALIPHRDHKYPSYQEYVMEKNWMPFIYKDAKGVEHVYVTYMVQPHVIFEVGLDGVSTHKWTTHDKVMFKKFEKHDVHGGPPVVYVPGSLAKDGKAHYIGIMHHIERFDGGRIRLYRHFAYKTAAEPPFSITGVSDELPLVFNQTYKQRTAWVAYVSGLFLNEDGMVHITYGAADIESRVLVMPIAELEEMFTGNMAFRDVDVPFEPYDPDAR